MAKMFNKIFSISLILLLMMSICSWGTSKAYSVKTSQSDSTNEQSVSNPSNNGQYRKRNPDYDDCLFYVHDLVDDGQQLRQKRGFYETISNFTRTSVDNIFNWGKSLSASLSNSTSLWQNHQNNNKNELKRDEERSEIISPRAINEVKIVDTQIPRVKARKVVKFMPDNEKHCKCSSTVNQNDINFIDTHPLVFDDLFRRAHWTEESLLPFFSHDPNKNDGPNNWENAAPACGGNHQSPIALNDRDGVFITNRPLKITGLHTVPKSILQQNDGHSVKFIPNYEQGEEVSISGGPLTDEYILQQFHFHWGSTDNHGSEHTLNKRRFANEVHFVFYNSRYRSFDEAAPSPRGLAVVAFFYEVNHSLKGSLLANGLESVINWNDTNTLDMHETFSMGEMIGDVPFDFISYAGSLTTPPCYETVTWIVSTKILQAAPRELEAFRKLKNSSGNQMVNNFRPLQKRNSRKFYYFFDY
uniref:Carbonic anhydrase n=1 Tax=Culicoides sonorensis TaxID=179676 RepID=A0A336LJS0_CULSO